MTKLSQSRLIFTPKQFLYKLLRYELVKPRIKICLLIFIWLYICTNQRIFVYAHVSVSISVSVSVFVNMYICVFLNIHL